MHVSAASLTQERELDKGSAFALGLPMTGTSTIHDHAC